MSIPISVKSSLSLEEYQAIEDDKIKLKKETQICRLVANTALLFLIVAIALEIFRKK